MNAQEKYLNFILDYKNALENFSKSLQIITLQFDEIFTDTIKSGQVKKYETVAELA